MVRLPLDDEEILVGGEDPASTSGQAQGRDRPSRSPRHPEEGRDLPEHGGGIPLRTRPSAETSSLLTWRLHLSKRLRSPTLNVKVTDFKGQGRSPTLKVKEGHRL